MTIVPPSTTKTSSLSRWRGSTVYSTAYCMHLRPSPLDSFEHPKHQIRMLISVCKSMLSSVCLALFVTNYTSGRRSSRCLVPAKKMDMGTPWCHHYIIDMSTYYIYELFYFGHQYWAKTWNILKQCLLQSETVGGS